MKPSHKAALRFTAETEVCRPASGGTDGHASCQVLGMGRTAFRPWPSGAGAGSQVNLCSCRLVGLPRGVRLEIGRPASLRADGLVSRWSLGGQDSSRTVTGEGWSKLRTISTTFVGFCGLTQTSVSQQVLGKAGLLSDSTKGLELTYRAISESAVEPRLVGLPSGGVRPFLDMQRTPFGEPAAWVQTCTLRTALLSWAPSGFHSLLPES